VDFNDLVIPGTYLLTNTQYSVITSLNRPDFTRFSSNNSRAILNISTMHNSGILQELTCWSGVAGNGVVRFLRSRSSSTATAWSAWSEGGGITATQQTAITTAQTTATTALTTANTANNAVNELNTRFAQTAGADTAANSVIHSRIFTANNATNHNLPTGLAQGVILSMARNTTVNAQFYMPATNAEENNGRAFVRAKGASTAHSVWRELLTAPQWNAGQSGFIRFVNGFQFCWGRINFAANQPNQTWTYPRAFSVVHNVQMTACSTGSTTAAFSNVTMGSTSITIRTNLPNAHSCMLFAIGRADS